MKVCTVCGLPKEQWEFAEIKRTGKYRAQCRACISGMHADQPSTTDAVRRGQDILRERFGGAVPLGCVIPQKSFGGGPIVCRFYAECRALPADAPVLCEVEDSLLNIPLAESGRVHQGPEVDGPWWFSENK